MTEFKLWRGNLEKGYYQVKRENEIVLCWYSADTLHSTIDSRKWRIESNVMIRPANLAEERSEDEERLAKFQVQKLMLTQSIRAKAEKALKEQQQKVDPIVPAAAAESGVTETSQPVTNTNMDIFPDLANEFIRQLQQK